MSTTRRAVVVGAGGIGVHTASFLARNGWDVTMVEQHSLDHDRGSSYGSSRIIRRVYTDRYYTALMDAAYPMWEALEREAGERLLVRTGGLFFGPEASEAIRSIVDALDENRVPYRILRHDEMSAEYAPIRLDPHEVGIVQDDAGLLRASTAVRCAARRAVHLGARLIEGAEVTGIDPEPASVVVRLRDGTRLTADRVVVCAGAWLGSLMASFVPLALRVTRQVYAHFAPEPMAKDAFAEGRFPVWIDFGSLFYGFPEQAEAPGVKAGWHRTGELVDANSVRRNVTEADLAPIRTYLATRFQGLTPRVLHAKVCLYTNTPDEDFVLDRVPGDPRLIVAGGGSGHAFKFAPLLGECAGRLAAEMVMPWAIDRFSVGRFTTVAPS